MVDKVPIDKTWRPANWDKIRRELGSMPLVWGTAMPLVPHGEQIAEATASKILEEFLKELQSGQTDQTDNIQPT